MVGHVTALEISTTELKSPGLELQRKDLETMTPFGASEKVLPGCRQLVP